MNFSRKVEDKISSVFASYGRALAIYPCTAIITCVLLNGLLGVNIQWMTSDSDIVRVYTPSNSQADQDRDQLVSVFPDSSGINFYRQSMDNLGLFGELIIIPRDGMNVLDRKYQRDIENIVETVRATFVTDIDDTTFKYDDLCARRNDRCVIDGDFLLGSVFWGKLENGGITRRIFEQEGYSLVIGPPTFVNESLQSATALKIRFNLRQDSRTFNELSAKWEKQFLETSRGIQLNDSEIAYQISDSLNIELDANTGSDIVYFSLTFTLMITYASFVASGGNCVSQRGHLGRAGVISAGLAILGAFGLMSVLHVDFVNIVGVMPFLIIGIGVDDMFIMMSGLADADQSAEIEDKIAFVMKTSGIAITITSLTNFIAFVVGITSVFKSVRNFCLFTASAVGFCYFNQITFFLGCMVLHERRVAANRHCVTCVPVKFPDEKNSTSESIAKRMCCTGSPAVSRNEQESMFEKVPRLVIPRVLVSLPAKLITVMLYLTYLAFSIIGVTRLHQGLILQNLVSENSYFHRFSNWDFEYFPLKYPLSFAVPTPLNYSSVKISDDIQSLLTTGRKQIEVEDSFELNWLKSYQQSSYFTNKSESAFVNGLKHFLNNTNVFKNDVVFNDEKDLIKASRFHVMSTSIKDTSRQGKLMLRMREIADDSSIPCFAFSPAFIFFEQYVSVLPSTLQTVGIAVVAVFVVACVLMPNPFLILCITISLASIITGVLGFMHFWGLSLSSITMIHVIMSVGFSVDFSAHICHAFLTSEGPDKNARVSKALEITAGPVFNSSVSSVIGIVMLTLSDSYVFISFFRVMLLVILFGLFHGMFVLPVVLSLIGPHKQILDNVSLFKRKSKKIEEAIGNYNHAYQPDS
ncbi:patched domain-containing protein 3-like [Mizuhopecten yessoensis]|uniref:Patched domain-containing protein 3 n=1 Tax=Mizuhopecten yessoensis TaxID=6573 RepID=A0A210QPV5_MIZYE|nr:patched domain-containing protein 3-like [Mizuhopecten yessoensis]OWF50767.1 Patched domain-containing protein 3 [Mizuhopecten yessoensis]